MATLPTKADLNLLFGVANIDQWVDANNNKSAAEKNQRVTLCITNAKDYILGRIARRYDISTFVEYPSIVFNLIVERAAVELYAKSRGLVDGDQATAQINAVSLGVEAKLDQILAGQLMIVDAPVQPCESIGVNNSTACFRYGENYRAEQWTGEPCVSDRTAFSYEGS